MDWKRSISQVVGSERIQDIGRYVSLETIANQSPIDSFYKEITSVMELATPDFMQRNSWIGSFLAIAIVSSTENYFRDVFCKVIKLCSVSKTLASEKQINLGSVIWHPENLMERGAFENISLASADSIKKTAKGYLNINITNSSSVHSILDEFDKVCELRHGIVHSGRVLAGKNAIKLDIPSSTNVIRVSVDYANLQEISSICTTLVVTFNLLLFETMCQRWATDWRTSPSWDRNKENCLFKEIWSTFHSAIDESRNLIPVSLTCQKCKNQVKKHFGLI